MRPGRCLRAPKLLPLSGSLECQRLGIAAQQVLLPLHGRL
jgi:hypothetical protein